VQVVYETKIYLNPALEELLTNGTLEVKTYRTAVTIYPKQSVINTDPFNLADLN